MSEYEWASVRKRTKKLGETDNSYDYALVSGYIVKPENGETEVDICSFLHTDEDGNGIFDDIESEIAEYFDEKSEGQDFMVLVKARYGEFTYPDDVDIETEIEEITTMNQLLEAMKRVPQKKTYGFVVEGVHDKDRLEEIVGRPWVVVTEGTRLNNRVFRDIELMLQGTYEAFVLTDPDEAGDRLAKVLLDKYPTMQRIELDAEECKCIRNGKTKIGFEHTSYEYARRTLDHFIDR